jgi:hypothetical protein
MSEDEQEPEEDRAARLSRRRKDRSGSDGSQSTEERSTGNTDDMDGLDDTVKTDKPESSDDTSSSDDQSEPVRLSQTTKEQMMHLPKDQYKRLHHLYTRMKADYEYEYDEDFEMNRQYFPVVLRYGLDQFEEQSAEEIRRELAEFDGSQSAPEEE